MLQAPKGSNPSPSIPFLPRQIMLGSAAAEENVAKKKMKEKEKKEKKRKEKSSSKALELDITSTLEVSKKEKCRDALLRSIAAFLDRNGFPKTFSALQSEADIEFDSKTKSVVNLEDLLSKFLEPSNGLVERETIGWLQHQDSEKPIISVETVGKKRKKTHEADQSKLDEECHEAVNLGEIPDDASGEVQVKDLAKLDENADLKKLKSSSNLDADNKDKKRKNKSASHSLNESSDMKQLEGTLGINEGTDLELADLCENKNKNKNKKKKHNHSFDLPRENIEPDDSGKLKEIIGHIDELRSLTNGSSERKDKSEKKKEKKVKDVQPEVLASDQLKESVKSTSSSIKFLLNDKDSKRKEKKKKHNLTPQGLAEPGKSFAVVGAKNKSDVEQDVQGSDHANTSTSTAVDIDAKVGTKSSKKRKRATPEEEKDAIQTNDSQTVNAKADKTNADADLPVLTKKMKKEQGKESNEFPVEKLVLSTTGEGNNNAANTENEVSGKMTNGSIVKTNDDGGSLSKETKMEKLKEPKSITPFQRVKIDEVKFADKRLQDNSYWAKGGADSGYGAKAQEVLGKVRGRDFRHEKTKKKRGTYRGGLIDLQSHSIKFTYSDEE